MKYKIYCKICNTELKIREERNTASMRCMCDEECRILKLDSIFDGIHKDKVYLDKNYEKMVKPFEAK